MKRLAEEMSDGGISRSTAQPQEQVRMKSKKKKTHPTFHFLAGLTSGISSAVLLQPADLLKTRVQQTRAASLTSALRSILSGPHPVSSLWRGTVPSALRTGFGSALYFTTLNTLRQVVANNAAQRSSAGAVPQSTARPKSGSVLPQLTSTANLVTGATARVLAGLILMPMTVIKVRYESNFYAYRSLASAGSNIYRTEGVKGFFSGFGATAIRDAPYAGLYVVFYEASKKQLSKAVIGAPDSNQPSSSKSASIHALSGVMAAGIATSITNPFDAVKTRLQLMPAKYGNMVKATRMMIREEGFKSFFDGLGLRMGRKAISSALAWTVYEELIGRAERHILKGRELEGEAVI